MAHNIAKTADGRAAMFYVDEAPWHGLGTRLDRPATARDAIAAAGLDFEVRKVKMRTEDPEFGGLAVPKKRCVVRTDTRKVIGTVGKDYQLFQNREAFGFFDAVIGTGQAVYHTAGALGDGERIWILAQIPGQLRVGTTDDVVGKYLLLTNTHDGSGSLWYFFTPIRVVCQNTLSAAVGSAGNEGIVKIRHTGNLEGKVAEAQRILGFAIRYYDDYREVVTRLSHVSMSTRTVTEYFNGVVPDNPKAESHTRTQNTRDRLEDLFVNGKGQDMPGVRGTLWAAFNAVAEYTDHARKPRGTSDLARANSRLKSTWFGAGATLKARAWNRALEIAEISA